MGTERVLTQLLSGGAASGFAGGLAGGLAGGMLTSKAGRKFGKRALQVGAIAALGGLAHAAWARHRRSGGQTPPRGGVHLAAPEPALPVPAEGSREADELGRLLLLSMIAAARADGKLDGSERRAIFDRVASLPLSDAEKAELFAQLERPVDLQALVAAARTPELAAEVYAASLLAIEVDTAAERGYLAMLAARLDLPDDVVASLHGELGVEVPTAPASGVLRPAAT
jgi:uncharacterized membrane protein YebE (DUF533 family)